MEGWRGRPRGETVQRLRVVAIQVLLGADCVATTTVMYGTIIKAINQLEFMRHADQSPYSIEHRLHAGTTRERRSETRKPMSLSGTELRV